MDSKQIIRDIFLHGKDSYSAAEAANLLGWSEDQMAVAIAEGEVEANDTNNVWLLAWQEVAAMATAKWPQEVIENALGPHIQAVIPQLVQLAELRVRVPRYEVVMLEMLAQRENTSVDAFLTSHLLDLAAAESGWLAEELPGLAAAIRWPEG
jgi:hypothetical protein